MKSLRNMTTGSLILTLAFFAGSFCLHPMTAQTMDGAADMSIDGQAMGGGGQTLQGSDVSGTVWNLCTINCASEAPQAVAAKQFGIDLGTGFFADTSDDRRLLSLVFSPDATGLSGTHPPSPDILFSVFKKE
jgi:hypothetical protein